MDTNDDLDNSTDDDDLMLDAIDFYQTAALEVNIDPDHLDALDEADRDLLHDSASTDAPSSIPVADFPMSVNLSENIPTPKTDDFW